MVADYKSQVPFDWETRKKYLDLPFPLSEYDSRLRKVRKAMEENGEHWQPRWFMPMELGEENVWKLKRGKEGYWEERGRGSWTNVVPVLKV